MSNFAFSTENVSKNLQKTYFVLLLLLIFL